MGSISKRKIFISNKDLKKSILDANKSFERKNKSLEFSIKERQKELKSLEKECSVGTKKYGKLLKDIEFQEDKFQKINSGVYSVEKLVNEKLKKVNNAEKELCEYESAVEKLEDRESSLKKEIEALEFYKAKCLESKSELSGIQSQKDKALDDLKDIKKEIDQLYIDHNNKVLSYESVHDDLEKEAKSHEDMVCRFEQRLFDAKDQALAEEKKLEGIISKAEEDKGKANDELRAIQNLVNNTEDKYVEWEQKVVKMKANADKENDRIKSAKERFANWRISILEEVARMKLKSKVENIDKAGLSEILNG